MWLGRFEAPLPLRCRGSFHVYAATQDGAGVVVVVPSDPLPSPDAARCLELLGEAHAQLAGAPGIARLREVGRFEDQSFISFDCDAVTDGEAVIARLGESGQRVEYDEAMAAVITLLRALEAAHGHPAGPFVLGAFSWANVLISRDGALHLFGFGHNVIAFNESGGASGAPSVFLAPEVATGAPSSPSADLYAFIAMQRALVAYAAVPAELRDAFSGVRDEERAAELATIVAWSNDRVLAAPPAERGTVATARQLAEREVAILGLPAGDDALRARLAALFAADEAPAAASISDGQGQLTISADASWLRAPNGERYELVGKRALRRLLLELARARRSLPGARIDSDTLLEAGWPGERPIREAGLNRVYVAISQLRKLGLRDVIQRDGDGYRIDPAIHVVVEPA